MRRPGRASRSGLGLADLLGLRAAMTLAAQRADPHPVKELLGLVTYRPGWTFNVWNGILEIRATVIDATDHSRECPLAANVVLPPPCANIDWQDWLFHEILKVERHEAQEFFQAGGVAPYDPHK
jgi:hypothetical protein